MFIKYVRKKLVYIVICLSLFLITSVLLNSSNIWSKKNYKDENVKIGIIFTGGGLGDKSFNDLAYDGLLMAQRELGIEFDYLESKYVDDYENAIRYYSKNGEYELIIAVGSEKEEAIKTVSKEFPNQKFTLIDSKLNLTNVSSIYTRWEEQVFLNGVIAGLETRNIKTNSEENFLAGVILGIEAEHLREGAIGFEAGFKYVNNNGNILTAVVNDYNNQLKAREIALLMYSKGVKYIQNIAGASGLGIFSAAKEADAFAFGIDANQNFLEPDYIVSTSTRYINEIIFKEIKSINDKTWEDGVHFSGLRENTMDITTEGSNVKLSEDTMRIVGEIKDNIVQGKLVIPSTRSELDEWIKLNKYES